MNIYELAKQFRERLLKREQKASAEILSAFKTVLTNLKPEIERLEEELNNPALEISKVLLLERYKKLEAQTRSEIARFSFVAGRITAEAQRANTKASFIEAISLIQNQTDAFIRLPVRAIESFVGFASDGSPLEKVFAEISDGAVKAVKNKLIESIALGYSPKRISSEIRKSFGTPATRAMAISRTESLRSYREASRSIYQDNANIVHGYIWLSARSKRTCAMCWAMDGVRFALKEPFATHPCCRCTLLPDLGKSLLKMANFDSLSADTQLSILGKGKFNLYSNGRIQLSDLVTTKTDKRWGKVRFEKPLKYL